MVEPTGRRIADLIKPQPLAAAPRMPPQISWTTPANQCSFAIDQPTAEPTGRMIAALIAPQSTLTVLRKARNTAAETDASRLACRTTASAVIFARNLTTAQATRVTATITLIATRMIGTIAAMATLTARQIAHIATLNSVRHRISSGLKTGIRKRVTLRAAVKIQPNVLATAFGHRGWAGGYSPDLAVARRE
jgi:hypothetical protein